MSRPLYQKETGFTLAEVLVTLMIVGIVASLTIPNIVKSTNNMQYYAGFMAAHKIVTSAVNQLVAEHGGDLSGAFGTAFNNKDDFMDGFASYLSVAKMCYRHKDDEKPQPCWHETGIVKILSGAMDYAEDPDESNALVLKNGMLIGFRSYDLACSSESYYINGQGAHCVEIHVDVNGKQGPNRTGRDIFSFQVYKNGVAVGGAKNTCYTDGHPGGCMEYPTVGFLCDPTDTTHNRNGISCGARLLLKGTMDY